MEQILTYWRSPVEVKTEPLSLNKEADVVIIGGGMAGLGTAYQLLKSDPDLDLWLLEAHEIGYGASGRNAGIIEAPLLNPMWMLPGSLPKSEANWALDCLHRRSDSELQNLKQICPHGELTESQTLIGATSRLALEALYHCHLALSIAGVSTRMVSADEVRTLCGSAGHGAIELRGYLANPLALTRDLAATVIASGGHIACGYRVAGIHPEKNGRHTIKLDSGTQIHARKVVVCTGAWTREIDVPDRPKVHPFATCMMASDLLEDGQTAGLGDESCCLSEVFRSSYRRLHQGRILYGGLGWLVKQPDWDSGFNKKMEVKLRKQVSAGLSRMNQIPWRYFWSGPTSTTGRGVPVIASAQEHPGIIYNIGFQAFLPAILSGNMVKGLVLGASHIDEEAERLRLAFSSSRIPWLGAAATGARLIARTFFAKKPV